jgi:hypothetical protein
MTPLAALARTPDVAAWVREHGGDLQPLWDACAHGGVLAAVLERAGHPRAAEAWAAYVATALREGDHAGAVRAVVAAVRVPPRYDVRIAAACQANPRRAKARAERAAVRRGVHKRARQAARREVAGWVRGAEAR